MIKSTIIDLYSILGIRIGANSPHNRYFKALVL